MNKETILDFLRKNKTKFQREFGIKKIGLFGSFARDSADETSDIDIVIQSRQKDFFVRDAFREHLENAFQCSVDIGYLDSMREFYRQYIEKDIIYV